MLHRGAKFIDDRLKNISISIYSTINKIKFESAKSTMNLAYKVNKKEATIKAPMFIEYALYLVNNDGHLRKSSKSPLGTELLKLYPLVDKRTKILPTFPCHRYRLHDSCEKSSLNVKIVP